MKEPKNILDQFFDKADEVMDKASVLRRIGTVEEEEERSKPAALIEWKYVPSSGMWHAFLRDSSNTRCDEEFLDTHREAETSSKTAMKTAMVMSSFRVAGVICCIICMIRTVR